MVGVDGEAEEAAAVVGHEDALPLGRRRGVAQAAALHAEAVALGAGQPREGEELVEESHHHRMVGELLQGAGHEGALVLRQGLWVSQHSQGVVAHRLGLVVGQHAGHQQPPSDVEEVLLLVRQLDHGLAVGVLRRQVAFFHHQRLPQVLVHHVGFGHPVHPSSGIRT